MLSDPATPLYEIRHARLYVNGERQAVTSQTVIVATALYRGEWKGPEAPIPEDLAEFILRMEARKAVLALRDELAIALTS